MVIVNKEKMVKFLCRYGFEKNEFFEVEPREIRACILKYLQNEFDEFLMSDCDYGTEQPIQKLPEDIESIIRKVLYGSRPYTELKEASISQFSQLYVGFYHSENIFPGRNKKMMVLEIFEKPNPTGVLISGIQNIEELSDIVNDTSCYPFSYMESLRRRPSLDDEQALQLRHRRYIAYRGSASLGDKCITLDLKSIPHVKRPDAVQDIASIVFSTEGYNKDKGPFLGGAALGLFNSNLRGEIRPILFLKYDGLEKDRNTLVSTITKLLLQETERGVVLNDYSSSDLLRRSKPLLCDFLEPIKDKRVSSRLSNIQPTWVELLQNLNKTTPKSQ